MHQRYLLAPLAALAAAALVACGGSSTDNQAGTTGRDATSGAASTTASPAAGRHNNIDVEFAQMMIPHHQQAVKMAKLAATRAGNPQVKQLAAGIEAAQQPEIATMTGWLTSWGQPTTMPGMPGMPSTSGGHGGHDMGGGAMPGMMSEGDMMILEGLTGTEFDRSFLTMMVAHHQGAIDMAKAAQTEGLYPPVIELAKSIQTSQTAEIRTMKALLTTL